MRLIVKGKPSQVRHLADDPEYVFAIEFHDTNTQTTQIEEKKYDLKVTALIHSEQWKQLLQLIAEGGDMLANANEIIMEGKVADIAKQVQTFAPNRIMYRSHAQQKEKEAPKNGKVKQKQTHEKGDRISNRVIQLHQKYDGVCQLCGQRCDKQVVTIKKIQSKMGIICPDCKEGTTFTIRDINHRLQQELLKHNLFSTKEEMVSYFQQFCKQFVLVHYNARIRMYWSWDKEQICQVVYVSQDGRVRKVKLKENGRILPVKQPPQFPVGDKMFLIQHPVTELKMNKIQPLLSKQKEYVQIGDLQHQMDCYEKEGIFTEKIVVKRIENSTKYEVVSGYTACRAAQKLNLKRIHVMMLQT
ncbi:hypothetical protein [Bacillus sp. CDB3]|uniref:hypothetical protein n=1 Tax=Bacillus sp. CDB3 TaxID=360310 RepID=UPI0009D89E47|nr:hypothetical protein [Bacillus sp. CDB3]OQR54886.1 hypothetical protein CDB3_21645 [Bacillus sp. CDB3]